MIRSAGPHPSPLPRGEGAGSWLCWGCWVGIGEAAHPSPLPAGEGAGIWRCAGFRAGVGEAGPHPALSRGEREPVIGGPAAFELALVKRALTPALSRGEREPVIGGPAAFVLASEFGGEFFDASVDPSAVARAPSRGRGLGPEARANPAPCQERSPDYWLPLPWERAGVRGGRNLGAGAQASGAF